MAGPQESPQSSVGSSWMSATPEAGVKESVAASLPLYSGKSTHGNGTFGSSAHLPGTATASPLERVRVGGLPLHLSQHLRRERRASSHTPLLCQAPCCQHPGAPRAQPPHLGVPPISQLGPLSAWKAGFYIAPIALPRALQQGPAPYSAGAQPSSLCLSPPRLPAPAQPHVASLPLPWQPDAAASPVATTVAAQGQIARGCGRQEAAVGRGGGTECGGGGSDG